MEEGGGVHEQDIDCVGFGGHPWECAEGGAGGRVGIGAGERAVHGSDRDGTGGRAGSGAGGSSAAKRPQDPCVRAENEDDDGYDPYSDRQPAPEPLFERDPWA